MDRQPNDHLGWKWQHGRCKHRRQILRWRTGSDTYTYTDDDTHSHPHSVTYANGDSDACGRMHRRYLDCY
jgi:hypothetical protein